MLVLALDTSSRAGSTALLRDGRVLREAVGDPAMDPAARLPGDLAALLASASVELADVDLLAVSTGPGPFTGLRVGIATMQGLAMALGRPLIGVSAFDALAHLARAHPVATERTRVATWIDAWRGDVFAAAYMHAREVAAPVVGRAEDVAAGLQGGAVLFTGDGALAHREAIHTLLGPQASFTDPVAPPLAGAVALLASDAHRSGLRPPPHAIQPVYVRRADVERSVRPRPV
jgi:tRNA threonylcarbamoyladenosine biosynthesis protein TsaB